MPALLPETHQRIRQYHETFWRNGLPASSYRFSDLPPAGRLTYELVNWTTIETYLHLFRNDPNPYVMDEFKTRSGLEEYAVHLLEYGRYSTKRGGCDWLLRNREGQYVGVLHLHALNRELIQGRFNPCMIGYAISEPFRRQGYAGEAVNQLLDQIPCLFHRYEVTATVHPKNRASQAVLRKAGFRWKEKFGESCSAYHKKLVDPIPLYTVDDLIEGRIS